MIRQLEYQCSLFEKELNDTINGYQNTIQILSESGDKAIDNGKLIEDGKELEAIDNYVDKDINEIVEPPNIEYENNINIIRNNQTSSNQANLNKI
jgi:hypothetical protein